MNFWFLFYLLVGILAFLLLSCYLIYRFAFYVPPRKKVNSDAISIPPGPAYEPFHDQMVTWIRQIRAMPHQQFQIVSEDGLKLYGKFYEFAPGAPIELMFHGYRGNAERDLSGGVERCFRLGRSALIVDQRCSGKSEGNAITFGIKEHRDCLRWIDFMLEEFGPDVKIILTGISMGAATVLIASGCELPDQVIGILADCGYNSVQDIIYSVSAAMKLPPKLCYPFVKLAAKLFAGFDPDAFSPELSVKNCKVPVIFFHGEDDDFVPSWMSKVNYDACKTKKELLIIPGAAHGLSFPVAPETYLRALWNFFGPEASHESVWDQYC